MARNELVMKTGIPLEFIGWDYSKTLPTKGNPYSMYVVKQAGEKFKLFPTTGKGEYLSLEPEAVVAGVDTVTGDGVDNTDPQNPIISFPMQIVTGKQFKLFPCLFYHIH